MKRVSALLITLLLYVSLSSSFQYAFQSTMPAALPPFDPSCFLERVSTSKDVYSVGDTLVVIWSPSTNKAATLRLTSLDPPYAVIRQYNLNAGTMSQGRVALDQLKVQDVGKLYLQIFLNGCSYDKDFSAGYTHFQVVSYQPLPIIFLPGIAGTELYSGTWQVWPLAPVGSRFDLMLQADGKQPAKRGVEISTGSILRSLRGSPTDFYGGMIDYLTSLPCPGTADAQKKCYREGENLFTYPYDWRLHLTSKGIFDGLRDLIDKALNKAREKSPGAEKVILLAHSLGGVIARYYLLSTPAEASKVDSLITIGSPFWGSPKAYLTLVHGYTFDNPTVRQELMKLLAQNAPAVYDLLPQAPFLYEGSSENVGTSASRVLSLEDTYNVKYKGYLDVESYMIRDYWHQSEKNIWSFTPGLFEKAQDLKNLGGTRDQPTPLPAGVKHYAIYGYGQPTLCGFQMFSPILGEPYIEVAGRNLVGVPMVGTGDGTVPYAGYEISKTATQHYYVSAAHGDLANNKQVQSIVGGIIKGEPTQSTEIPFESTWRNTRCRSIFVRSQLFNDVTLDMLTFELHSAAHLTITGPNRTLGFNSQGGIVESQPSATFLSMDGVEYAAIAGLSGTYTVNVNGTHSGKFTLNVTIIKNGVPSAFSYSDVPVKNGTVAQMNINPNQITNSLPPLQVTTDGKTTSVFANTPSATTTTTITSQTKLVYADFTLPVVNSDGLTGRSFTLSSTRGRVVLLNFMEPWSPHCQNMAAVLNNLYSRYGSENIVFVSVSGPYNGATARDAADFVVKYGTSWTYVYDSSGTIFSNWGVNSVPTFFIIGKNGAVSSTFTGEQAADTLASAISAARSG